MMLRYSLGMPKEADAVEQAVTAVLEKGHRCADIAAPGEPSIGCQSMGALIAQEIKAN